MRADFLLSQGAGGQIRASTDSSLLKGPLPCFLLPSCGLLQADVPMVGTTSTAQSVGAGGRDGAGGRAVVEAGLGVGLVIELGIKLGLGFRLGLWNGGY